MKTVLKIGKYALENGKYPLLTESTVRNFKKSYNEKLQKESKKMNPQPVTSITPQPRGWPPILLELDTKLIKLLCAIRAKSGIVNSMLCMPQLRLSLKATQ